ncbi:hypothetical protein D3871_29215 [Noviherbaspirillum saxi]|uniref:DUF4157 domain-containing protein n=2 Tax=Noviherbaspirillum saxi TaxID=2320863 RepID=A0A3A3G3L6_9BURK|nr:hypothetical protein D3871_29215 [Noviherbaspirillum saxi]
MDLASKLPELLQKATTWAEGQSEFIMEHGSPLSVTGITDARVVGVSNPEAIRVCVVQCLPLPIDNELRTVALETGLLAPNIVGLTLGHGIFIVDGHGTRRLLSHEFRHVHQYEQAGSISAFLSVYLSQIASVGYREAPLEIDARYHEIQ